ncbi:hypothetical protein EV137_6455 [Kribbella pratensis]|uniref:LPXTG cell wall anchor domain-containing protein n=1 Tax=Kribbella pratensis TaxID=2512112 RepID=A0ABY2FD79_9ACTN|nr:hypothetical protein [Kribbella pratensis]TDW88360.1 hypothetical protein EV137_6455 [Kribbella pratensis]
MKDTSVGANGRLKNSRVVALLGGAGAVALALGGVTLALAPSASADGIVKPGNPTCAELVPGSTEIKFDPPNSGEKTADGVTVKWQKRNLAVDDPAHDGDQTGNEVADFTATGGTVLGVIVKGGNQGANFYDYAPAGTVAGIGLHTPVNEKNQKFQDISHITFCVTKLVITPTPSVTPSETPSTTPSETPSTTPSETPSETPSTTPSETPSETPSTTPSETPSETPSTTPSETPSTTPSESPTVTVTATPSESPTVSPTSTTSSAPVGVPTDVDAGLSGGMKNASATTSSQSAWGIALLTLGGLLVFAGVLKARQRRGQHSA